MKHEATERTKELATPKRVPASYRPARSIESPVKGKTQLIKKINLESKFDEKFKNQLENLRRRRH